MKSKKFYPVLISFDGYQAGERAEFNTISETWDYINDMGSKWFFYPFCFVASGQTIEDSPELLPFFIGRRINTVKKAFKKLYAQTQDQSLNVYDYMFAMADKNGFIKL